MISDLIKDEDETRKFLNKVLLPLENDEVYIIVLTARKKYCPTISSSLEVVSRDIIRNNDIDRIIRKIRRMSIVEGIYVDKDNNTIPIEAFSMYILPEPRSTIKAYMTFTQDINKWNYENLMKCNIVEDANLGLYRKLDIKLFSAIHKSRSRSDYFIIDIDKKDEKLLEYIIQLLEIELVELEKENILQSSIRRFNGLIKWISETRGGYHVILNRNETTGKFIHKLMNQKIPDVEFRKETMTPVVGMLQGGFVVKEKIYDNIRMS